MATTTLNIVSIKMADSDHTYLFAYDDSSLSLKGLEAIADLWRTNPELDFSYEHLRALRQGIQNNQNQKLGESQGEIKNSCEKLLDQLFSTPYGGVVCLIDDCCPLYTIIETLRSLLSDEGVLYRIETLTHIVIKLPDGPVKHAYFVRESESEGLPLENWSVFDMTGLGEIN